MKFRVSKKAGSDQDFFEEREIRKAVKDGDADFIVAKFLEALSRVRDAWEKVEQIRGGPFKPDELCPACRHAMVWVDDGDDKRWICPNCVFKKLRGQ